MRPHQHIRLTVISLLFSTIGFSQSPDLPNPPANIQTLPAGSLVIAMDNTNQANPGKFNLKAYGLLVTIMNNNKRLRWVIRAGKAKDAADFSVTAEKLYPLFAAASFKDFKAGPFVMFPTDTFGLANIINTFNNGQTAANRVNVYRTSVAVSVDVRYDLAGHKPKAAILNDGGNASIHTGYMVAASIPTTNYVTLLTASNLSASCYTFASEPHNANAPDALIDSIRRFVQRDGGNFLAECAAVRPYENSVNGHFHYSGGLGTGLADANDNIAPASTVYPNPDLSISQFEGVEDINVGGSLNNWRMDAAVPGNHRINNQYNHATGGTTITQDPIGIATAKIDATKKGGLVTYLGGHKYSTTDAVEINGVRVYLNAYLTPARYPSCPTPGLLAVTLVSFNAKKINNQHVQLYWTTANEFNSKEFIIERSGDGISFSEIGRVASAGNSNTEKNYTTKDLAPLSGKNFYRLAELDRSGVITYSSILVINFNGGKPALEIYPNPARQFITVSLTDLPAYNNSIAVYDIAGETVISNAQVSGNSFKLNVDKLSAGTYFIKVTSAEGTIVQNKFVVLK